MDRAILNLVNEKLWSKNIEEIQKKIEKLKEKYQKVAIKIGEHYLDISMLEIEQSKIWYEIEELEKLLEIRRTEGCNEL